MATFHALSMVMGEDHKPMTTYTDGFVSSHLEGKSDFIVENVMIFAQTIAEWGPEMKIAATKLFALGPKIFEKLKNVFAKNQITGYNVLNHGDFHIKNILFKDNNGMIGDSSQFVSLVSLIVIQKI